MHLGLDAALTLKRHADVFVLVAGDGNFARAMKFAPREGAQLFLVTLGGCVRICSSTRTWCLTFLPEGRQ
jgi:uncharacterized LabA/DUF88 family protein